VNEYVILAPLKADISKINAEIVHHPQEEYKYYKSYVSVKDKHKEEFGLQQ
jgi:hypothetical protein